MGTLCYMCVCVCMYKLYYITGYSTCICYVYLLYIMSIHWTHKSINPPLLAVGLYVLYIVYCSLMFPTPDMRPDIRQFSSVHILACSMLLR